jgi:hypothetical protein
MMNSFFKPYSNPRWQKKAAEIRERASYRCEMCGSDGSKLNVHHGYYEKNMDPWEYPNDTLFCLCDDCHAIADKMRIGMVREIGKVHPKHDGLIKIEDAVRQINGRFFQADFTFEVLEAAFEIYGNTNKESIAAVHACYLALNRLLRAKKTPEEVLKIMADMSGFSPVGFLSESDMIIEESENEAVAP